MRKYTLQPRTMNLLRVRAKGTACYVCAEGLDTAPARPREFLNVEAAEKAFAAVAPEGWEPVVEPVPLKLGTYGTGVLTSNDGNDSPL